MDKITFKETSRNGDATITYSMAFTEPMKLSELIEVLVHGHQSDSGTIKVNYVDPSLQDVQWLSNSEKMSHVYVEYRNHAVTSGLEDLRQLGIYDSPIDMKKKSWANGGWGMMNYSVYVV